MALVSLSEYLDLHAEQDATLVHTCTVTRLTAGTADVDGQPTSSSTAHLTNEPCHFLPPRSARSGGEIVNNEIQASVTNPQLILSYGTDVRKTDTVTAIRNEYGVQIGGPYNVLRVDIREMHVALQLEEIA